MQLRFEKDRRTLVWALGVLPLGPLLVMGSPKLAYFTWPLTLYAAYCAGVLTHNHTHVPVFREREWNRRYGNLLSFFYGCPIFAWIPTHHRIHHRYVNGPQDSTRTTRYSQRNSLWALLSYPTRSAAWQWPDIKSYALSQRARGGNGYRDVVGQTSTLLFGHVAALAASALLHGSAGVIALFLTFTVPTLLAPSFMMFTNYVQHVDCDPSSVDNHSRNFVNPFFNWFIFDNGYHTVHHEQPSLHWSLLREVHIARAHRIEPRLNQSFIAAYCFKEYLALPLMRLARRRAQSAFDVRNDVAM